MCYPSQDTANLRPPRTPPSCTCTNPPQQRQNEDLERSRLPAPKHPGPRPRRVGREPGPPPEQSRACSIGGTRRHTKIHLDAASIKTALVVGFLHPLCHPHPGPIEEVAPPHMPIVTGPLPLVSLFIAMAHMPIQVDLTNDASPHWTEQGATTPPAQPQTCAICLHDIHTETRGPDVPFEWPACRHVTHLQCAMQHVSHQARPTCPTCRQQWTQEGGHAMEAVRARHNVPWMVPETPRDTRTHQSEVPPAPDHLIPLCCPRLALIDHQHPEHDASWRELPVRHMDWAPTLNQTTQQWQPEWVCLRCTNTITPDHPAMRHTEPAPHCPTHGPRSLAIDLRQNERGWVCSRGYPPHILPCEPTQIPNAPAHVPQQQPNEPIQPDTGQWFRQGPPNQHQAIPHANSWLFVPLLLAGANRLQEQTEQQWRADPCAGHDGQTLVDALRTAPPIPWRDLPATIATLQQLARDSGH